MGFPSTGIIAMSAQALLLVFLFGCVSSAKLPQADTQAQNQGQSAKITSGAISSGTVPAAVGAQLPLASGDDLEVVAHTGGDGFRQKRYIGWGRRPSLRYNKARSLVQDDNLFNRIHNNFDKRAGPDAPISSFRELRMKQKTPNIQLLLPHLQLRNTRIPSPDTDVDDGALLNELPSGGKLTQEDLEALAYLLEGDMP